MMGRKNKKRPAVGDLIRRDFGPVGVIVEVRSDCVYAVYPDDPSDILWHGWDSKYSPKIFVNGIWQWAEL